MLTNPLLDVIPEKARKIVYALLTLGAVIFGCYTAAEGDWTVFVGSVVTALIALMATSNTSVPPDPGPGPAVPPYADDELPFDERGVVTVESAVGLLVVVVIIVVLLRVLGLV